MNTSVIDWKIFQSKPHHMEKQMSPGKNYLIPNFTMKGCCAAV